MAPPNFQALARERLPENEQSDVRLDAICDDITSLLYRAHRLAHEIDPDLGEYFERTMTRALTGRAA